MALINKYQDFENLTAAMLNELVDKIVVYERDRKGSIQTTQRIDIYFSFITHLHPERIAAILSALMVRCLT